MEKELRPLVVVEEGRVSESYPGCGEPVVVDLDELEAEAGGELRFGVGLDDAEIEGYYDTVEEALEAAKQALEEGRAVSKVDLEVADEELNPLEVFTLYEDEEV